MKIPETSANVGAYYGNEENGQWQPNGVIIDTGVGGGVVGSGDAGIHRPPVYPVHIPRGHIPAGYVMAGAYYPPAAYPPPVPPAPAQNDFADYMWMEDEEEFDKQVMQQLEEEALMEQCIEAMLEDEQRERHRPVANGHNHYPTTSNGAPLSLEETVSRSTLNPLAAEFIPGVVRQSTTTPSTTHTTPPQEEKQETPSEELSRETSEESSSTQEESPTEVRTSEAIEPKTEFVDEVKTDEPVSQLNETPEVSAADVQPIDKRIRDSRKDVKSKADTKKPVKQDTKPKAKSLPVKSETKLQPKKKEVKPVKSESKLEEKVEKLEKVETEVPPVIEAKPPSPPVTEEFTPSTPGVKPINYAAAAKANKPKKPTTPPITEKSPPQTQVKTDKPKTEKIEKKDKITPSKEKTKSEKPALKTEKVNVQRKNSTK